MTDNSVPWTTEKVLNSKSYPDRVQETRELISQFSESVFQYEQFGTEEDAKAVTVTWPGAKSAVERIEQLRADLLDYVVGSRLQEEDADLEELNNELHRLEARYKSAERTAKHIAEPIQEEYGIPITEKAGQLADEEHKEYFEELEPRNRESVAELMDDLGYDF